MRLDQIVYGHREMGYCCVGVGARWSHLSRRRRIWTLKEVLQRWFRVVSEDERIHNGCVASTVRGVKKKRVVWLYGV